MHEQQDDLELTNDQLVMICKYADRVRDGEISPSASDLASALQTVATSHAPAASRRSAGFRPGGRRVVRSENRPIHARALDENQACGKEAPRAGDDRRIIQLSSLGGVMAGSASAMPFVMSDSQNHAS